jgi:hypothetical protein
VVRDREGKEKEDWVWEPLSKAKDSYKVWGESALYLDKHAAVVIIYG